MQAFLEGRISYTGIAEVVEDTLAHMPADHPQSIGDILEIDARSRVLAREMVLARAGGVVTA